MIYCLRLGLFQKKIPEGGGGGGLGGGNGKRYIFLWVVGAGEEGRKNIICLKKREVLSNLAKRKRRA